MSKNKEFRITYILDQHTRLAPYSPISTDVGDVIITELSSTTLDQEEVDGATWQRLRDADFILLITHGGLRCFQKFDRFKELFIREKDIFISTNMEDEMAEIRPLLRISMPIYLKILRYIKCRDQYNIDHLHRFLAHEFGGMPIDYAEPRLPKWDGLFLNENETPHALYESIHNARQNNISVCGLLIPFHLIATNNLSHIKALISSLKEAGLAVLPIFSIGAESNETEQEGISAAIKKYLYKDGELLVDVILNTISYSLGVFEKSGAIWMPDKKDIDSILVNMNLPIIQAYYTYYTEAQWRERIEGVDPMNLISAICYPEFDGQIDGYPIGVLDEQDTKKIVPLYDGIDSVVRLVNNWAKLRRIPNSEKKVAIIFHNMPPRNDMIGCAAGLDTPASVYNMLNAMEEAGIDFENRYENGDQIIQEIINTVSNDTTWLSDEETLNRAIDSIHSDLYKKWYSQIPLEAQKAIEKHWDAAPGDFKVIQDVMPVPGILNKNVFIALQPPRGYEEQAEKIYHSTDISCPHFYIAIYKWIKYIFQADVVVHVGTHGSLEWLPGKEKGLSKSCFPIINIDDLPHLYPYHTTVIGEGIQAKRRSAAVLLHHLEPVSTESGTYDDLTEIDHLVTQYLTAPLPAAEKELVAEKIIHTAKELNLDKDLNYELGKYSRDDYIVELHKWLGVIKHSMVKDGLHIFGQPPRDKRLEEFVRVLLRVQNAKTPSLAQVLAEYYGYDYNLLREKPEMIWASGKTSIMIRDELVLIARQIVSALRDNRYQPLDDSTLLSILGGSGNLTPFKSIMQLIVDEIIPKLERTSDELDNYLIGLNGGFVLPSKGGSPSRGNLDILPTGRNMYSIVPDEMPSQAAYELGKTLGKQLLEKYLMEEENLPESIAFVLYSGDQMRTHGEDIGEILWLMGLRPKWLSPTSDRVIGLEVIPLEELGRPRIDVISRISGLLRDTFPNLISLLDEAIKLVVKLEEPLNMNYPKKHYEEDLQNILEEGVSKEIASQEAAVRVFGCPPGTYGGGVDILVEAKNWQSDEDLANAAINWSAHAYTGNLHGHKCIANYERQLSKVEATVKNENTIDFDLFDIDDEFIYHGGLIASVKKCSGKTPHSFYGNSSDPSFTGVRSVKEESARVMRARLLNPIWIDGLKQHGYKGAQDVAYNMDNIFGWDATAQIIEDWNYEALTQHFLGNAENKEWMKEVNPWALKEIAEKLLEAAQRGMWNASEEALQVAQQTYIECEGLMEENTIDN